MIKTVKLLIAKMFDLPLILTQVRYSTPARFVRTDAEGNRYFWSFGNATVLKKNNLYGNQRYLWLHKPKGFEL